MNIRQRTQFLDKELRSFSVLSYLSLDNPINTQLTRQYTTILKQLTHKESLNFLGEQFNYLDTSINIIFTGAQFMAKV